MATPDESLFPAEAPKPKPVPEEPKPVPKDPFRDIKIGKNLVARVFRDGRVTFGFLSEGKDSLSPIRIEVEATVSFKEARNFCEGVTGMVNQMEGRY